MNLNRLTGAFVYLKRGHRALSGDRRGRRCSRGSRLAPGNCLHLNVCTHRVSYPPTPADSDHPSFQCRSFRRPIILGVYVGGSRQAVTRLRDMDARLEAATRRLVFISAVLVEKEVSQAYALCPTVDQRRGTGS